MKISFSKLSRGVVPEASSPRAWQRRLRRAFLGFALVGVCLPIEVLGEEGYKDAPPLESQGVLPKSFVVDSIRVEGLSRTEPRVITRELSFREGDLVTQDQVIEDRQRLMNLRLFSRVRFRVDPVPDRPLARSLLIDLEEKWTIIPSLKYKDDSETKFVAVGVSDINFWGLNHELGLEYESFNGVPSGSLFYQNPRFYDEPVMVGGQLVHQLRKRMVYDSVGHARGVYYSWQDAWLLFWGKRLNPNFSVRIGIGLGERTYTDEYLSQTERDLNQREAFPPPHSSSQNTLKSGATWGHLDYDNELIHGQTLSLDMALQSQIWGASQSTADLRAEYQGFWLLPLSANVAIRSVLQATTSRDFESFLYLGGNGWVRGYLSGQFAASRSLQVNAEYRIASVRNHWINIQHVVFVDTGAAQLEPTSSAAVLPSELVTAVSSGLGLRIFSPRIHGIYLRGDVTLAASPEPTESYVIGFNQFF